MRRTRKPARWGTSAAYAEYISSYPQGRHAEEAQRMKEQAKAREDADDAAYAQARKAGTSVAYAKYLSAYPQGRHAEEARRMKAQAKAREDADDAAYAQARKAGTSAAFKDYFSIKKYPDGRHADEARRKYAQLKAQEDADDAAYAKADLGGTPAAYDAYLSAYPNGRHAEKARRLKTQIELLIRKWPAGKALRDCPDCPEMVVYPAGSFMMGSPADAKGGNVNEGPPRLVTIARPFAVGKYEVTISEYEAFVSESGRSVPGNCNLYDSFSRKWKPGEDVTWRSPGFEQSESHPVVCVSWNDAKAYVKWLSQKTNREYRLPSEAEWEYAARVGPKTKRNPLTEYFGASWGEDKSLDANYRANCYGCISFWGGERDGSRGFVSGDTIRSLRRARQRPGVGEGLLEPEPCGGAIERKRPDERRVFAPRCARRFLVRRAEVLARREPREKQVRKPGQHHRVSRGPDAHPLSMYRFASGERREKIDSMLDSIKNNITAPSHCDGGFS